VYVCMCVCVYVCMCVCVRVYVLFPDKMYVICICVMLRDVTTILICFMTITRQRDAV
jgi:hypothetical protein